LNPLPLGFIHGLTALLLAGGAARSPATRADAKVPPASREFRGVVMDDSTRQRLAYAHVIVLGTTRGVLTDAAGRFHLPFADRPYVLRKRES
jgi:hypothetical protein